MDIKNLDLYNEKEQYHIKTLSLRKDTLCELRKRSGKLDEHQRDELSALIWVFSLLEEISQE